jgi:hypothetical protein
MFVIEKWAQTLFQFNQSIRREVFNHQDTKAQRLTEIIYPLCEPLCLSVLVAKAPIYLSPADMYCNVPQ